MELNFIAPINQLGYGIAALNILKALSASETKIALWVIGQAEAHPREHELVRSCMTNANYFNVAAPCLRIWHQFDMAMHVGRGMHTGLPIFELDTFNPIEMHHLQNLDHVFVPSKWAQNVLAKQGREHGVSVAPFGVDRTLFYPQSPETASNEETVFLNIGKWEVRKGHDILVEAFNAAFDPKDNVVLLMNCYNPFYNKEKNDEWAKLYKNSKLGDKIHIRTERLETQAEVAGMMNSVDAGVFPARAEGWNLELLEMMSCGKPVIATNYAGHTEFVNNDNSLLINCDSLEDAFDGIWFRGQGQWAELGDNQLDQLVQHMRDIHDKKRNGESLYNKAGVETAEKFSWKNTADAILKVLTNAGNTG